LYTPVIPAFGRLRQKNKRVQSHLGYIVRLCLKTNKQIKEMLQIFVKLILEFIKGSEAGVVFNHELPQEVYILCHCLLVLSTVTFKTDLYNRYSNVALVAYLGTITNTCSTMN
jgi:hypothetical protein